MDMSVREQEDCETQYGLGSKRHRVEPDCRLFDGSNRLRLYP